MRGHRMINEFMNNNWYWWFVGSLLLFISPIFSKNMRRVAERNNFDGWAIITIIWPVFLLMFFFEKADNFIRRANK